MNLQDKIETETEYRVKGDLILTEDFKIDKNLVVEGNIRSAGGKWNIDAVDIDAVDINAGNIDAGNINAGNIAAWNIAAWNINARNIDAGNINALDIDAGNIDAVDIDAVDIDARDIICEKRIKKTKDAKTICRIFIDNKSKLDRKERMKED